MSFLFQVHKVTSETESIFAVSSLVSSNSLSGFCKVVAYPLSAWVTSFTISFLKSLAFVDEIILVDNFSLDKTVELSKKYTNKIFTQKNNPEEIDIQKNFGFEKASFEWILSIDADEEVSKELAGEIKPIYPASMKIF